MKKNILITGANGFIGGHIVERLVQNGESPHLILREKSNLERIKSVLSKCDISFGSIENESFVEATIRRLKPEMVIHLASFGVHTYTNDDLKNKDTILKTNIQGSLNLFEQLKKYPPKIMINTGSCFEYGDRIKPFTEDDDCHPVTLYGLSKLVASHLAHSYARDFHLPVVTLRPFTVYGPHQDSRRFVATAIAEAAQNKTLPLPYDAVVRDYIYIDDVVDAYVALLDMDSPPVGEIINISTSIGISLYEMAHKIAVLTHTREPFGVRGAYSNRKGEVKHLIGDNKKAKQLLRWEARYTLDEGLKKTIDLAFKS